MAKANPFRFSTKYQDDETDLFYYGYRAELSSLGGNAGAAILGEKATPDRRHLKHLKHLKL
jgi:hypothetical protein